MANSFQPLGVLGMESAVGRILESGTKKKKISFALVNCRLAYR